ncbi:MAG: hypothetical protein IPO27_06635 [Bacteroidetes bacterium]|nr:hypothetical protein [Bacteroidota bacterium]
MRLLDSVKRIITQRENEPLLIIGAALAALSYLSFTGLTFQVGKPIDLFADIRYQDHSLEDSIAFFKKNAGIKKHQRDSMNKVLAADVDTSLFNYFSALNQLPKQKRKIRIAWMGDSMIEGDLVTNDFRKLLQKKYGGNGVGFVGITSPTAKFRGSVNHTYSGWTTYHFRDKPPKAVHLGIAGYTFLGDKTAVARYKVSKEYDLFGDATLLYGKTDGGTITIQADTNKQTLYLDSTDVFGTATTFGQGNASSISIFDADKQVPLYGVLLDRGPGIYVDNFSFRGNSGITLSDIDQSLLYQAGQQLNYKLIIMSYGLNVVGHNIKKYDWYERGFIKTLAHIRKAFPEASILLMSVSDKSHRKQGEYETEPDIPIFVELQKKMAKEAGIGFWNLYEAMGGYNSMKHWVEDKPRLANYDYTHPNFDGAKKLPNYLIPTSKQNMPSIIS